MPSSAPGLVAQDALGRRRLVGDGGVGPGDQDHVGRVLHQGLEAGLAAAGVERPRSAPRGRGQAHLGGQGLQHRSVRSNGSSSKLRTASMPCAIPLRGRWGHEQVLAVRGRPPKGPGGTAWLGARRAGFQPVPSASGQAERSSAVPGVTLGRGGDDGQLRLQVGHGQADAKTSAWSATSSTTGFDARGRTRRPGRALPPGPLIGAGGPAHGSPPVGERPPRRPCAGPRAGT